MPDEGPSQPEPSLDDPGRITTSLPRRKIPYHFSNSTLTVSASLVSVSKTSE